jgi:hypothetical protein
MELESPEVEAFILSAMFIFHFCPIFSSRENNYLKDMMIIVMTISANDRWYERK